MKYKLLILLLSLATFAAAQDFDILSQRDISGSARYVGMSGAMTAIGGDPTAAFDNPAVLGQYKTMEAQISLDLQVDHVRPTDAGEWCDSRTYFIPSMAVGIFSFSTTRKEYTQNSPTSVTLEDVPYLRHAILVGFRRLKNYSRLSATLVENPVGDFENIGQPEPTPFRLQTYEWSEESGYVNDFTLGYGLGIQEKWFVGASLDIYSYRYAKSVRYDREYYDINSGTAEEKSYPYSEYPWGTLPKGETGYYDDFSSSLILRGVGASLKVGFMGRPVDCFSFGFSVQTPSISTLNQYDSRTYETDDDSINDNYSSSLSGYSNRSRSGFHMPMRTSTGVAFHILQYAKISLQYDWAWLKTVRANHELKAGIEIRPVPKLSITLGGAYCSPFRKLDSEYLMTNMRRDRPGMVTDSREDRLDSDRSDYDYRYYNHSYYISGGLGYIGKYFQISLAYQYRRQQYDLIPNYSLKNGDWKSDVMHGLVGDTHRFVLTLGISR